MTIDEILARVDFIGAQLDAALDRTEAQASAINTERLNLRVLRDQVDAQRAMVLAPKLTAEQFVVRERLALESSAT